MRGCVIYSKTNDTVFPASCHNIPNTANDCWMLDVCMCVCVCAGEAVSTAASPLPRNALISPISAIPNQVKAAHGTEEGNSTHNGNISVLLLCVAFLQLIRSKYLTRGVSVLAPTSVVHLLLLSSPPNANANL